nr:hypothetical protein [Tanacetum cinerariifolium]
MIIDEKNASRDDLRSKFHPPFIGKLTILVVEEWQLKGCSIMAIIMIFCVTVMKSVITAGKSSSRRIIIKKKKQSTPSIPLSRDDRERDEMAEATILSLTLHKTTLDAEAKEKIAKPGSHKEHPEHVSDDDEMKRKDEEVKLAVNKDREVSFVDIYCMVSKEFATHGPKLIKELFQKHMQNTTLNLYPKINSSTATTSFADPQQQLYLSMKTKPHDQAADLEI